MAKECKNMAIKFVTGYSGCGGSTVCLLEHCKLLDSAGFDVFFYGDQDWHLTRYRNSRRMSEFSVSSEDVIIYHYIHADHRPNCSKFLLFLQETSLYDLRTVDRSLPNTFLRPNVSFFDEILFVSESHRSWHGFQEGRIVPNFISHLVDKSAHRPPDQNIAGVVGHVHPIKNSHVSIQRALEDGVSMVKIYGPAYPPYFDQEIRPLLSDRVIYMGHYEPERRMEMYNEFDVLYHFGEYESACLVLGECRIIGKSVVKCDALKDYDIRTEQEILQIWKSIID